MELLTGVDIDQVSGGVRTLQEVGTFMGIGAGAALLLGPAGVPIAMALGLGSAAFLIVDSFQD